MSDYFIGLTGGIASGKSALEREFVARGIFVADSDLIARQIVEPGQPALDAVVAHCGASVLTTDGRVDRMGLRALVFDECPNGLPEADSPLARRAAIAELHRLL